MALNHISHFFALNFSLSGRYSASDHGKNAQEERNFAKVARNLPVWAAKEEKKFLPILRETLTCPYESAEREGD